MNTESAHQSYRRDLGDGLVLRWSTSDDIENIAELVGRVFRDRADEPLNTPLGHFTREMMSGTHPVMGPGDFALVEDTRKQGNPLVACTCLWRHTWEYEGIPFRIGRPEIVATDPDYRNRRLIRAIFDVIHARSETEGHLVQAITGHSLFLSPVWIRICARPGWKMFCLHLAHTTGYGGRARTISAARCHVGRHANGATTLRSTARVRCCFRADRRGVVAVSA